MRHPPLIVALDVESAAEALRLAKRLRGFVETVKIGSTLFTEVGPDSIRRLRAMGFDVMLDLKWFDIPSTVERSVRAAARHRVQYLTVHTQGGRAMLRAAVRAARQEASRLRMRPPRVLGVTALTSIGGAAQSTMTTRVLALAREARAGGCDGVVASVHEARAIRRRFGRRLRVFCPGIRPVGAARGDQARIASPAEAVAAGADALIIGRPITHASDPVQAVRAIQQEIRDAAHAHP